MSNLIGKIASICIPRRFQSIKIEKDLKSRVEAYDKIIDTFFDDKNVKAMGHFEAGQRFEAFLNKVTTMKLELDDNKIPNVKQLQDLHRLVEHDLKVMVKKPGLFSRHFYIGTEFVKNHPVATKTLDKMLKSNETLNVDYALYANSAKKIYSYLREDSEGVGIRNNIRVAVLGKGKIEKKLIKMQNKYYNIYNKAKDRKGKSITFNGETGPRAAESYRINEGGDYKKSLEYFTLEGEAKVYGDFMTLVTMETNNFNKAMKSDDFSPLTKKAAWTWREEILNKSNHDTTQAFKEFLNILNNLNSETQALPEFKQVHSFISSQIKQFEGYQKSHKGLFPVMTLNVFPALDSALSKIVTPKKGAGFSEGAKEILSLKDVLQTNIYTNQKLGDSSVPAAAELSYNYIALLDSYSKTAAKLRHSLTNTGAMLDIMNFVTNTRNRGMSQRNNSKKASDYDEVLNAMQNYMANTYMYQMGLKDINPQTGTPTIHSKITRMLTSAQFFSKLGFNVRSAARNAGQAMFHYIHFGFFGIQNIKKELERDPKLQQRLDIGLKESGLEMGFMGETTNIREVYGQLTPDRVWNPEKGRNELNLSFDTLDKLDNLINRASKFSGKGMQWVENNWNRNTAYKYGFIKGWMVDNALEPQLRKIYEHKLIREYDGTRDEGRAYVKSLHNQESFHPFLSKHSKDYISYFDQQFDTFRQKRAQNAARDIVRLIHFDYSGIQKAPIFRTKTGALAGQFQHYGWSLFVLQKKWLGEGLKDVKEGHITGEKANRMHRLFFTYTMINGILSPLLNVDLGNLIQNDTMDRLNKWWTFWGSDDDEEREQAFFNKGPVAGSLGPTVSTAIDIKELVDDVFDTGDLFNWYDNLDDDDFLSYITGREYAAKVDDDISTFGRIANIFNIQMGRIINGTGPRAFASRNTIGTALTSELGLYSTKSTKKIQEAVPALDTRSWFGQAEDSQPMDFNKEVMKSLQYMQKTSSKR